MCASKKSQHAMPSEDTDSSLDSLFDRYHRVRKFTHALCEPLETEDYVIQTMDDVSPTKWHLAHTSWFFETFILSPHCAGYQPPNSAYRFLFNSYYNAVGGMHYRPHRGFISRPTVAEVFEYREHVDRFMADLLADDSKLPVIAPLVEIGIHHEQQHQELMLTDIKHVLSCNPLRPSYHRLAPMQPVPHETKNVAWVDIDEGVRAIGYDGDGFCYDNETPRHKEYLQAYRLASRLVTNGEFLQFIEDGGYRQSEHWLSEGWAAINEAGWSAPLYWEKHDGRWQVFSLFGLADLVEAEPVSHVSYFEADAYARWAGHRLPTEAEWEVVANDGVIDGNFADTGRFHPAPSQLAGRGPSQLFGDVWEWTQSPYVAYPGYRPAEGALGEYNGKFMCNQFVLRGGSCATSRSHVRASYRNFFPASARWQFSGVRLASDGGA